MLQIGKVQTLTVVEEIPYGAYLASEQGQQVMLPVSQLPVNVSEGDTLTVFVYHDHDGQLTATGKIPKVQVGQCAMLEVVGSSPAGAFLDWGMDKDLFVPRKQQARPMQVGDKVVVIVYVDKLDGRVAASSKLHLHLSEHNAYLKPGDAVSLLIVDQTDLGFKAVINNHSLGLIYQSEVFRPLQRGDRLTGYIKCVRDDGKIDLTLQAPAGEDRDELSQRIINHLRENGGRSPITDKADPKVIQRIFKVSKGAYKKALGNLYKQRAISLSKTEICLSDDEMQ